MYAVRNWKLDFDKQEHIAGARRWMATVGQVAGEDVGLEFCWHLQGLVHKIEVSHQTAM